MSQLGLQNSGKVDFKSADLAAWGITSQAANTPTGDLNDLSPETYISELHRTELLPPVSPGGPTPEEMQAFTLSEPVDNTLSVSDTTGAQIPDGPEGDQV